MKKLVILALVTFVLAGCVSNQAFRSEQERLDKVESALAQNNTELGVLRKEIMQDRRVGGSGSEELEALTLVVREISEDQLKQSSLMQEDIAYLMDRINTIEAYEPNGEEGAADPNLARKLNDLAASLERNSTEMNVRIAELEKEISGLKSGTLSNASAAVEADAINQLKADMEARIKAQEAELASLREAMNQQSQAPVVNKPVIGPETTVAAGSDVERNAYEAARMEYNNGNYDKAISMLSAFIAQYPNSDYAGNAYYWKGESLYAKSDWAAAQKEFQKVVSNHPDSWKVADSQLKIGMCYMNMGEDPAARAALNQLKSDYPYYGRMDLVNIYLGQLN